MSPQTESKPALVSIDDDADVSRAVARDLRRRYGGDYRVVRAESGAEGLDALREMKLRGDQVALLLADYRMPEMSGIEFLEQAMDLYPKARRLLLTAYADTAAAIDAINVVDLDYYLMKPWDPPEDKLYPVLDEQLESWRHADHRVVQSIKVVGHRWSARSTEVRELLSRNRVPYRWYTCEDAEGQQLLAAAGIDDRHLPVIVTAEGKVLVEPSDAELAAEAGLETTPSQPLYDLAVIGGGPAGLGAAVYGASEGLRTVMLERVAAGGQAGQSSRIENYLGFPDGVSGAQLTDRARRQALRFGAEIVTACEVVGLDVNGPVRTVQLADGTSVDANAVILATGVSYRQLPAPGLAELTGRGVYYGSSMGEAKACAGQDIYLVGGANSAGQAAVYFSRHARTVTILVRGPALEASMSYYLVQQLGAIPNVVVRTCTEVVAGKGEEHLERLTLRDSKTGDTEVIAAEWLFIFIGATPRTEWLDGVITRDGWGFVPAGPDLPEGTWAEERAPFHLETSVPGVFVAGDARADSAKRVASAVGEGAMAVMLVHRYLETR
ncbi:MAG: FAD-dependent oxidoreductase [Acidimicrobiales bacterium]